MEVFINKNKPKNFQNTNLFHFIESICDKSFKIY